MLEKQRESTVLNSASFPPLLCLTQPPRSPLFHHASCQALQKEHGLLVCTRVYVSGVQDTCPWDSMHAYTPHVTDCDCSGAFPTPGTQSSTLPLCPHSGSSLLVCLSRPLGWEIFLSA